MTRPCAGVGDSIVASAGGPRGAELARHLASCAACAAFAASIDRHALALRGLPRHEASEELDGLVVAAFHAGHRQERAIDAVRALTREPTPSALDQRLWERGPRSAPAVLDRLVAEDLADPEKALSRRYAGRLQRLSAPEELRRRITMANARRPARFAAWSTVAFGVLIAGLATAIQLAGSRAVGDGLVDVTVERVATTEELSPLSARMFAGFAGPGVVVDRALRREE